MASAIYACNCLRLRVCGRSYLSAMDKKQLRQLIIDSPELGLIINERLKLFPQIAKFYRKYKRSKFWIMPNGMKNIVSEYRYYSVVSVLCYELKHNNPEFWLTYDVREFRYYNKWFNWQNRITMRLRICREWSFIKKSYGHPLTDIFNTSCR